MHEFARALGYSAVFIPPALLVLGVSLRMPWLAVAAVFGVAPFLRAVFGDVDETEPEWSEPVATWLDRLPVAYAIVFPLSVFAALWEIKGGALRGSGAWVWAGLSLWTCFIFCTVISHELVHHRRLRRRRLGRALAGFVSYPILGHEHMPHHAVSGNVVDAEWPALDESVWRFAWRRTRRVIAVAAEYDVALSQRRGGCLRGGLAEASAVMLATGLLFGALAGTAGLMLYACVAAGVWFAMQAITYLQHWGLGQDSVPDANEGQYGWEDGCALQGWMTLSISFHQAHHRAPRTPFYRAYPIAGSPRLPAGYVILLFASLVPCVWRWLMLPALARWKADPASQRAPGRRLICFYNGFSSSTPPSSAGGCR